MSDDAKEEVHEDMIEKFFRLLADSSTVNKLIENNSKIKKDRLDFEIERNKQVNNYWFKRYWQDIGMTFLILTAIVSLSYMKILESNVVGTLMGSVIGYSLARLKKGS